MIVILVRVTIRAALLVFLVDKLHLLVFGKQNLVHDQVVHFMLILVLGILNALQQFTLCKLLVFLDQWGLQRVDFEEVDQRLLLVSHHPVDQEPGLSESLHDLDDVKFRIEFNLGVGLSLMLSGDHARQLLASVSLEAGAATEKLFDFEAGIPEDEVDEALVAKG